MTAGSINRVLALLDVLLGRAALVIEGDHALGRAGQIGDDEADARIEFAQMPFDLGDGPAFPVPRPRLIAEAVMKPQQLVEPSGKCGLIQSC